MWGDSVIHIGTSGWSYQHWRGVFYPNDLPTSQWRDYYTRHFQTVELNSSYYHWPADARFAAWAQQLPDGFLLSVKAPRGLTHSKQLYAPEQWLARIERGLGYLGRKRGILLVQLAPQFPYDRPRLAYFLEQLPPGLPTAIEFRHPSWHHEELYQLLERFNVAYCVMSGANLPCILRATASFVYVRFHGPDPRHLYGGSYSDDDMRWWADRIREWRRQGKSVFAYFNNDGGGNAVRNAATLRRFLGQ
jgi:uncharacterized protein YecE (DUF72 family)